MTGARMRELRAALGLTVREWADLLGVNAATVWRWESAPGNPPISPGTERLMRALSELSSRGAQLGEDLKGALYTSGGLGALYVVLQALYGHAQPMPAQHTAE